MVGHKTKFSATVFSQMPATYRADRNPDRRLRHAAWKGDIDLAAQMLDRGTNIEGTDADGMYTPFTNCISSKTYTGVLLLSLFALRMLPFAGFTPALIAARWNRLEMLRFLMERGADINARNQEMDSAYNLAVLYKHSDIENFLKTSGADTSPNNLREGREDDRAEWLAMLKPATPSREQILQMRKLVHDTYAEMMAKKRAEKAKLAVAEATGLSQAQAAKQLEKASAEGQVVGQLIFPVGQKVVKRAPRSCKLGVGSMGLALFDGVRPLATWPYKTIKSVSTSSNQKKDGSGAGELVVSLHTGKKTKISFQTLHADEIMGHIEDKMQTLNEGAAYIGGGTPRAPASPKASEPASEVGGGGRSSPTNVANMEGSTTIWVGNVPETVVTSDMTGSNDFTGDSKRMADIFGVFGTIVSITTRHKPGLNKCWALITFKSPSSAAAAIAETTTTPVCIADGTDTVDVQVRFNLARRVRCDCIVVEGIFALFLCSLLLRQQM
eukprot:SAG31_NODE_189_length_20842_cov_12.518151_10_plen_497_part_00